MTLAPSRILVAIRLTLNLTGSLIYSEKPRANSPTTYIYSIKVLCVQIEKENPCMECILHQGWTDSCKQMLIFAETWLALRLQRSKISKISR